MTGETQPARMSVMHVEVPMQVGGGGGGGGGSGNPAPSTGGKTNQTNKSKKDKNKAKSKVPTVVDVPEEGQTITVDVTVPAPASSVKPPTVVRPKPPTTAAVVRPLPPRAASVHTVPDVEIAVPVTNYAEIEVEERSEHAPGTARGEGTRVVIETHPAHPAPAAAIPAEIVVPTEETVVEITPFPASVGAPTAIADLDTRSIAPSHRSHRSHHSHRSHSHHPNNEDENALGLTSTAEMPFPIPRLSHRSHTGHHGGHHRRSLHATVKIPMQVGQPAQAMAKAESPPHAAVAEIGPAPVVVEAPKAETVVVQPGQGQTITARASITNSPPKAPTVIVTPPSIIDSIKSKAKGNKKKDKNKGGSGSRSGSVSGEGVVAEATVMTGMTTAGDTIYPHTVAQTIVSPPRPIIQVVEMPRGASTYPSQQQQHRHTHRFPHAPSSASSVPAAVGPPVFLRTEKTPAPPSMRGSPHMHTVVHHPGKTEFITLLPDDQESPPRVDKKKTKTSSASDKGASRSHTRQGGNEVTASHPAPGVTRIEVRPVLQNSVPVYTERVMMRGPDVGVDPHPAGRRFSELRPIPIIDYRSFLLSPIVTSQPLPLPQIIHPAPGPPTDLQTQRDYLDDHRTRSSRKGHHRRRSGNEESKMTSSGEHHKGKDSGGEEDYYHRSGDGKRGDSRHRRHSGDRHRHHHHHHGTDTSSVVPTPRHGRSSRSITQPTGDDTHTGSHHHHSSRHRLHHRRSDEESIPVYRSTPEMTPPADRFAKYAYPPTYEKIKEREEKQAKAEAEKAAAKAAKGQMFPPGGYLAMGNQMYARPPPLGMGMYGGMMPGMGMMGGMMGRPFGMGMGFGRGF